MFSCSSQEAVHILRPNYFRGFSDPPPPFSAIETVLSQFVWQKDTFLKNFLKGWDHPAVHCLCRCRCKHFHFHGEPRGRAKVCVSSFRKLKVNVGETFIFQKNESLVSLGKSFWKDRKSKSKNVFVLVRYLDKQEAAKAITKVPYKVFPMWFDHNQNMLIWSYM